VFFINFLGLRFKGLLLKEGLTLVEDADGGESTIETVRFIDWGRPEANDFLLVSQCGDRSRRAQQ
jgi:type I site-specific restriction-modification system R (restriction) subunit